MLLAQIKKDSIKVFYLGGQSNMEGFGYVKNLPDSLKKKNKDFFIYQGNPVVDNDKSGGLGKWDLLQPGHGSGFSSDGKKNILSDRFGVELSLAKKLQELYPNQKLAFIKYARNGSSIDSVGTTSFGAWEPDFKGGKGMNQYDYFLKTVNDAMAVKDINGDGVDDVALGVLRHPHVGVSLGERQALGVRLPNLLGREVVLFQRAGHYVQFNFRHKKLAQYFRTRCARSLAPRR